MISYTWSVTTAPTVEVMSLAEAKLHLGIGADETQWDTYLPGLIVAARRFTERRTNLGMVEQVVTMYIDQFPSVINLPISPGLSVTSVKYRDTAGVLQTLDAAKYQVDVASKPPRISEAYAESWPTTREMMNAVEVIYKAGFGTTAASVPGDLVAAVKLLLSHWFENREAVGTVGGAVAVSYEALVRSYRVRLPMLE